MFTQCPKCETVFKLSAEVLRAAGGQVRCGRCGEVFNALARLAEDASAFPAGESPLEMETRADEILHSAPVAEPSPTAAPQPEDFDATDAEFARLQVIDLELYDDDRPPPPAPAAKPPVTPPRAAAAGTAPPAAPAPASAAPKPRGEDALSESSLEFTLPPGELDRIFVEPKPRIPPAGPAGGASAATAATAAAPTSQATPAAKGAPSVPSAPAVAGSEARKPVQGAAVAAPAAARGRLEGLKIPDEMRREMLAEFKPAPLPEIAPPHKRSLSAGVWLAAAIALALLLVAQIFHANRDWLAAKGIGLGLLPPPANLSAYQLRQWGVTGDPGAKGALRVRASILNTAAQLQPYPLLRVTLANRFGSRIGTREFEPAEYLGKPTVRMLAPGERVDATLDILDPGKDAEGFEIDVCLRGADHKVACAADAAPQTKR